ncbi:MAG: hypothetical protein MI921_05525 [Cytophagales bacterium]|nr:hypothetical protein [Cytophagales bacterium]
MAYQAVSKFEKFEGRNFIRQYEFQYLDAGGRVLTSATVRPISNRVVLKNITLPLIGRFDDGERGNNLSFSTDGIPGHWQAGVAPERR